MNSLSRSLLRAASDLGQLQVAFAVVGGLAVAVRTEPRFTRDADLAVSVEGDDDVESLVFRLRALDLATRATTPSRI